MGSVHQVETRMDVVLFQAVEIGLSCKKLTRHSAELEIQSPSQFGGDMFPLHPTFQRFGSSV